MSLSIWILRVNISENLGETMVAAVWSHRSGLTGLLCGYSPAVVKSRQTLCEHQCANEWLIEICPQPKRVLTRQVGTCWDLYSSSFFFAQLSSQLSCIDKDDVSPPPVSVKCMMMGRNDKTRLNRTEKKGAAFNLMQQHPCVVWCYF